MHVEPPLRETLGQLAAGALALLCAAWLPILLLILALQILAGGHGPS